MVADALKEALAVIPEEDKVDTSLKRVARMVSRSSSRSNNDESMDSSYMQEGMTGLEVAEDENWVDEVRPAARRRGDDGGRRGGRNQKEVHMQKLIEMGYDPDELEHDQQLYQVLTQSLIEEEEREK